MRRMQCLAVVFAAMLVLTCTPYGVGAVETNGSSGAQNAEISNADGKVRLTIDYGNSRPDPGSKQTYRLYHVADVVKDKDGNGIGFSLRGSYVDLEGTTIPTSMTPYNIFDDNDKAQTNLTRTGNYINQNKVSPDYSAEVKDGKAVFTDLPEGLYLGSGPAYTGTDNKTHTPVSFLISLPYLVKEDQQTVKGSDTEKGVVYTDVNVLLKTTVPSDDSSGGDDSSNGGDDGSSGGGGGKRTTPKDKDDPAPDDTTPPGDDPSPDDTAPPDDDPSKDNPPEVVVPDDPSPPDVKVPDEPSKTSPSKSTTPSSSTSPSSSASSANSTPKLPQTGQLWWPVPILAGGGLVLMLAGLRGRSKSK